MQEQSRRIAKRGRSGSVWVASALAAALTACAATGTDQLPQAATAPTDPLAAGFLDPPNSARPRVWWHWLSGNISQDGIHKDLEWMKRVGIGGLQNFNADLAGKIIDQPLPYMTPEWKEAFRYAVGEADRLGLEFAIAGSPGWSESGGPWVKPEDAMKKLVWSQITVPGGKPIAGPLPVPPSVAGPYQAMQITNKYGYYADALILAYPATESPEIPLPKMVASNGDTLDAGLLTDDDQETGSKVDVGTPSDPGVVDIQYPKAQTIRSATVFVRGAATIFNDATIRPQLQVRDGDGWRVVADIPLTMVPTTASFAPVRSDEFRLVFATLPGAEKDAPVNGRRKVMKVDTLRLSNEARVNDFEVKAGFSQVPDYYALDQRVGSDVAGVSPAKVLDLTQKLKPDGTLDWTPPRGRKWTVLRLGYSLTGTTNHPAPRDATGLEVDKYDGPAVGRYLDTYLGMYRDALGGDNMIGGRGIQDFIFDSTEVGPSNWTSALVADFKRLRGYDPTAWLPALTGEIVGSRAKSDAFLYDFRRTLADLVSSEHYAQLASFAHAHGMKLYNEALESGRPSLGDDLAMRASADIPMAALWSYERNEPPPLERIGDLKGASSIAHFYGQNLAAAESMTSSGKPWGHAPTDLKHVIDFEFAQGINRPVIHCSVHQPLDKAPGLSLALFGQFFTRLDTWAEMAKPWIDYIARNAYMLQQGRDSADVAYFIGEEAPLTALFEHGPLTDTPTHYGYDFVNADALGRLTVAGDELMSSGGARYRVLYLGGSSARMTLAALRRIAALVSAGATVVGGAPTNSPSLADDHAEFERLKQMLWGSGGVSRTGKGRVIDSHDIEVALASISVGPDYSYSTGQADSELWFQHRKLADGDIYFVNNRRYRPESAEVHFRVTGKVPELWHPDSGAIEPVSFHIRGSETAVSLQLEPEDAVYVVFRRPATQQSAQVSLSRWVATATLDGPWEVSFQADRGAPLSALFDALQSLTEQADPGIRYFSGVATYRKTFRLPDGGAPGSPLLLDLGKVGDVAQVRVNGKLAGTAWKTPWQVDIGQLVHSGQNDLEIRVANLWVNRLIGDAQPNAQRVTFTSIRAPYKADAPLRESGLIGPVQILQVAKGP